MHNESYIGFFPFLVLLFFATWGIAGTIGKPAWSFLFMPIYGITILVCTLRSGLALDAGWRATIVRGTGAYKFSVGALIAWILFTTALSCIAMYRS